MIKLDKNDKSPLRSPQSKEPHCPPCQCCFGPECFRHLSLFKGINSNVAVKLRSLVMSLLPNNVHRNTLLSHIFSLEHSAPSESCHPESGGISLWTRSFFRELSFPQLVSSRSKAVSQMKLGHFKSVWSLGLFFFFEGEK